MLHNKTILIVDDPLGPSMDIAAAIAGQRGTVAGPVATRGDALANIAAKRCDVALIDADLPDAAALIEAFSDVHLPYVLHAAGPISEDVARTSTGGAALFRPVDPAIVITMIAIALERGGTGV